MGGAGEGAGYPFPLLADGTRAGKEPEGEGEGEMEELVEEVKGLGVRDGDDEGESVRGSEVKGRSRRNSGGGA